MTSFGPFMGLLPHTAVVYRRQQVGGSYKKDRFGQPTRDELFSHLLECRATAAKGQETYTDRTHDVVEATHTLFFPKGSDISEQDVVTVLDAEVGDVEAAAEEDPKGFAEESNFHNIATRANVLMAVRNTDMFAEHHRQVKIGYQRESGEAR